MTCPLKSKAPLREASETVIDSVSEVTSWLSVSEKLGGRALKEYERSRFAAAPVVRTKAMDMSSALSLKLLCVVDAVTVRVALFNSRLLTT